MGISKCSPLKILAFLAQAQKWFDFKSVRLRIHPDMLDRPRSFGNSSHLLEYPFSNRLSRHTKQVPASIW